MGPSQGCRVSTHLLTAKVKSRNLLRSMGFSRAAPDFMASQICRKNEKGIRSGLLVPLASRCSSSLLACHCSPTLKWLITSLCLLHTASPAALLHHYQPARVPGTFPQGYSARRRQADTHTLEMPISGDSLLPAGCQACHGCGNKKCVLSSMQDFC